MILNRRHFLRYTAVSGLALACGMQTSSAAGARGELSDNWLRPISSGDPPIWGHRQGLRVGIWPSSVEGGGDGGPRGLVRIGYPILDSGKSSGLVNFIAVEPIVKGSRGLSELEASATDGKPGKLFWTSNPTGPAAAAPPDPGVVSRVGATEWLTVRVYIERFANGAQPIVDMAFRSDRPGEVQLSLHAAPGSEPMDYCVTTATMGNYERLRLLWLAGKKVLAGDLWPGFTGTEFTPDAFVPGEQMIKMPGGDLLVCATPNEKDPHSVPPDPVAWWWAYRGSFPVTQYWRKPGDKKNLRVRVNGRRVYWASHNPIPGGLAFENFDLMQPYGDGQTFIFGLSRNQPPKVRRGQLE